jgi:MFS family permease
MNSTTESANPAAAAVAPPRQRRALDPAQRIERRYITAALMLVMVLASMEQTVTATAMPTIIGDLNGLEHYSWVSSIYLLACTVSMPLYGRLADALGRKRVILVAIGLFLASSVLAASAHSMTQLIIYRGLQGLGAGGIMPVVLTIIGDIFSLQERASIQGFFSAIWGTASLAGPALGALLVNKLGWRSVFFVNLPFGVLGLAVLIWKYTDREKPHSTDLDLPGVAALSVACLATLALVSGVGPGGWPLWLSLVLLVVAVICTVGFIRHERRAANPIMPPALMAHRLIGPSVLGSMLFGVAFLSLDTFVPLYMQGGRGGGATAAASVVTPVMLTWALSAFVAGQFLTRLGFRTTALVGSSLIVVGFAGLLVSSVLNAAPWVITAILALTGFGFGPTSMSFLLAAQEAVTWQQRGIITSTITFSRTMGGAIGIGLLGALFTTLTKPEMELLRSHGVTPEQVLNPASHQGLSAGLLHAAQHMIASSLIWVFAAMLLLAVVQIGVTMLMPRRRAEHRSTPAEGLEAIGG